MKEQLPLKRIFIGLIASVTAGFAVTAAGTINETALFSSGTSYAMKNEVVIDYTYSVEATVVPLNHEENTKQESINITDTIGLAITPEMREAIEAAEKSALVTEEEPVVTTQEVQAEEYKVEDWWKAEVSDYSESLEQEELVPIQTEETADSATETGILEAAPAPSIEVPPAKDVSLPSELEASTFYFTSYGYGHGVGMSQNGANFYAIYGGYDYLQILQHYYPGTTVKYTPGAESETISVRNYSGGVVDILSMVCNAEVGSSFDVEAIKAQAVAAYTYIKYAGGSTSGMAIKPNPDQKIIDAVKSVAGQAVYYEGSFALTQFCASSGGTTASCKDIFYEDIPYLRSVPCEYDAAYDPHYGEVTALSVDSVRYKIQRAYGIYLSSDYSSWIQLIEGDGGYIADVCIDGQKTVDGYEFARTLGLKSGKFTVYYT